MQEHSIFFPRPKIIWLVSHVYLCLLVFIVLFCKFVSMQVMEVNTKPDLVFAVSCIPLIIQASANQVIFMY